VVDTKGCGYKRWLIQGVVDTRSVGHKGLWMQGIVDTLEWWIQWVVDARDG